MKFKRFINNSYTQISIYVIVVATIIIALNTFIGNVPYFLNFAFDKIGWIISASHPIILALVFTYLLDPVADFFEERLCRIKCLRNNYKARRAVAVLLVCLLVVVVFTVIISLLVSSITNQIKVARFDDLINLCNQYVNSANELYDSVIDKIGKSRIESLELKKYITEIAEYAVEIAKGIGMGVAGSLTGITSFFTNLFLALIMTIYFLLDEKLLKFHLKRIAKAFMKEKTYNGFQTFINDADTVFSGYIRGQCMDAFIMMIMICVSLSIIGVKMAVVIGICAGIGNLIPYVGPIIAYAGTVLSGLINGDIKTMIIAIIALVIIQLLDGNVIGPKLLSNAVEIHPLIVIISLVFGSAVGGLLGMLLAVPVGALIKVIFMKYVDKRIAVKESGNQKDDENCYGSSQDAGCENAGDCDNDSDDN